MDDDGVGRTMGKIRFGAARTDPLRISNSYTLTSGRRGDLYLVHRTIGNRIKVSLHARGVWKVEENGRGPTPGAPTRHTWRPSDDVRSGRQPAIRVLFPGGGLTRTVHELEEPIQWAIFTPNTAAVEFKVHIVPADKAQLVLGPGISLIGVLPLKELSSLAVVIAEWHDALPVSEFSVSLPEQAKSAVEELASGRAEASMWKLAAGKCMIIDTLSVKSDDG